MKQLMKIWAFIVLVCVSQLGHSAPDVLQYAPTQATYLQITDGSYIQEAQVHVYCAAFKPGQVVSIYVQGEVTNPNQFNVGIGAVIKAWDYYVDALGASTWVATYNANPPTMTNVTPDMHHLVVNKTFGHKVTYQGNANTRCYTLVLWAVSSRGSGIILVEQGYGYLQVLVH